MIKLIRGLEKKLKGKAIIYSEYSRDIEEKEALSSPTFSTSGEKNIAAVFFATNPLDFIKKLGLSDEEAKKIKESGEFASQLEKLITKFHENRFHVSPAYVSKIQFNPETDIQSATEDIIFTGKWNYIDRALNSMKIAIAFYQLKLEEQDFREVYSNSEDENKANIENDKNYKNIPREEFLLHVSQNYLGPMIDMKRSGNTNRFNVIKLNFLKFSIGAPFFNDVKSLINLLEISKLSTSDISIMSDYINKMEAILTEDYLRAGRLRDKINSRINSIT